jgi:hypothetical protein
VSCETIRLSLRCPPTTIFLEQLALVRMFPSRFASLWG